MKVLPSVLLALNVMPAVDACVAVSLRPDRLWLLALSIARIALKRVRAKPMTLALGMARTSAHRVLLDDRHNG